jgi:oligopeptide transport system ATP-binding protein
MTEILLRANRLTKHFPIRERVLGRRLLRAVDGVDLEVRAGETLGIVGESGCGKSTLGYLLIGLLPPSAGTVTVLGEDIHRLRGRQMQRLRRDLQIVFQDPYASLNPRMTVGEIIERPLLVHRLGTGSARRRRVTELLDAVGLASHMADRYPHEFSGGQRQRIAIARAIATNPKLVVADEPTSALDVSVQARVLNLLKDLQTSLGLSYVFISHDIRVIRHMCDRVAVMYLGKVVETAGRAALFDRPRHPYTRALLADVPALDPRRRRLRATLEGDPPSPIDPPAGCRFHPRCPWAEDRCRTAEPALREIVHAQYAACHLAERLPEASASGQCAG